MNWSGPIKPVNVRLPWDLHSAVKSAAAVRPVRTVERAYVQALNDWLAPEGDGGHDHSSSDDLTDTEAHLVSRVLAVARSGNRAAVKGLLAALEIGEALVQATSTKKRKRK